MKRLLLISSLSLMLVGAAHAQAPSSFWQFNEPSGTTVLDSVGSNNGTISGGVVRIPGAAGQGGALSFDNTTGQASVGNSLGASTGLTIEALIRPSWNGIDYDEVIRKDIGGTVLLSFQNDGNSNGFAFPAPIGPQGPVLSFGLLLTTGGYTELDMPLDGLSGRPTLAGLKDGNWHYVAAIYDNLTGIKRIAIDGVTAFSTTFTPGNNANSTPGATVIGNSPDGSEPFNGGIDQVAVYGRALSASEVSSHYSNVIAGRTYFTSATAPEPSTLVLGLLALPTLSVLLRRRKSH